MKTLLAIIAFTTLMHTKVVNASESSTSKHDLSELNRAEYHSQQDEEDCSCAAAFNWKDCVIIMLGLSAAFYAFDKITQRYDTPARVAFRAALLGG